VAAIVVAGEALAASVTVWPVIVAESISSEKPAVTLVERATPLAPPAGLRLVTVGGVVSGAAAVVKLQLSSAASGLPAVSFDSRGTM
jgi:hypothetical protein